MFYKLRLKLTFINAAVIAVLFLMLTAGTYYAFHNGIARHSQERAQKTMNEILSGSIVDFPLSAAPNQPNSPPPPLLPFPKLALPDEAEPPPPPHHAGPYFFYIRCSSDGAIVFQSSNQPLNPGDLAALAEKAFHSPSSRGTISAVKGEYPYLKAQPDGSAETIILFQDFTHENQILRIQLTALISAGFICLLLALLSSFFVAKRAMIPIQNAWEQQKDFLSDASHELRTPLAVIQTNLELVLANQEKTVASQSRWLKNIQEETTQMTALVNSLLFLARADSNQQPINSRHFSLTSLLNKTAAAFEPVAKTKGLELFIPNTPDFMGYGDEAKIKQLLTILLDNAIRHTPAGGKITVSLSHAANYTVLNVADTGEGISLEAQDKIFDRFYQVDKARNKGGAGLGLSIAKWIVENHGGTIQVASKPTAGATFTIYLPTQ